MKKICIHLLIFCGIIGTCALAQNVKVVNYLYRQDTILGLVPFDQHFVMNISQIGNINSFTLKIYEVRKYDYKCLKNKNNPKYTTDGSLSMELIKKHENSLAFSSKEMKRDVDYKDSNCRVQITAYLDPNSRYIFEMTGVNETPLSDDQKLEVQQKIKADKVFKDLINDEIKKNIDNPDGASGAGWGKLTKDLEKITDAAVKSVNPAYLIRKDVNFVSQLTSLSKSFVKSLSVIKQIDWIYRYYLDSSEVKFKDTLLLEQTKNTLIAQLKAVDWVSLEASDTTWLARYINRLIYLKPVINADQREELNEQKKEILDNINSVIEGKNKFIDAFTVLKSSLIFIGGSAASTYVPDFVERAKQHVTFDLGYAYIWGIDRTNAYAGINIYFRAVDTSLPLKNYRAGLKDYFGSHFSLLIGTSLGSVQKDSVRKGLLGNGAALVTGIGYKLLPWFKINGGAYLYYKYPVNPLVNKDRLTFTGSPFVSLSIDVNLKSLFNSFGSGNIANVFKTD